MSKIEGRRSPDLKQHSFLCGIKTGVALPETETDGRLHAVKIAAFEEEMYYQKINTF